MHTMETNEKLQILGRPIRLDLSLNDLRTIVGCFRAVAYLMKTDDEPYLDADGLDLYNKMEETYERVLKESGVGKASCCA